jgi:hypothetical protein
MEDDQDHFKIRESQASLLRHWDSISAYLENNWHEVSQKNVFCRDQTIAVQNYILHKFTRVGTHFSGSLTLILEHVLCSEKSLESGFLLGCSTSEKIKMLRKALTQQGRISAENQQFNQLLDDYQSVEALRLQTINELHFTENKVSLSEFDDLIFKMQRVFYNLDVAMAANFKDYQRIIEDIRQRRIAAQKLFAEIEIKFGKKES